MLGPPAKVSQLATWAGQGFLAHAEDLDPPVHPDFGHIVSFLPYRPQKSWIRAKARPEMYSVLSKSVQNRATLANQPLTLSLELKVSRWVMATANNSGAQPPSAVERPPVYSDKGLCRSRVIGAEVLGQVMVGPFENAVGRDRCASLRGGAARTELVQHLKGLVGGQAHLRKQVHRDRGRCPSRRRGRAGAGDSSSYRRLLGWVGGSSNLEIPPPPNPASTTAPSTGP